jgi:probable rRNA maturation factor
MTVPGDISPSPSAIAPAPADPEPPPRLVLTVLTEAGDWSGFACGEEAIRAAATALAGHPRCESAVGAEACVVLADNALVQSLNRSYRGKDAPTNVLSFPFQAPPGAGTLEDPDGGHDDDLAADAGPRSGPAPRELGDVVLAVETVAREAGEQGIAPVHHLQHLVVHGLLHLMGFDHETDAQAEVMEGLEVEILASLGIADPYAAPHAILKAGEV